MKKQLLLTLALVLLAAGATAQKISPLWEELTSPDFAEAIAASEGVCVIPLGVIEKHGPHMPLGTDVYQARYISTRAAEKEYCIVFPYFFAGVISEAKHQPGTISYSPELLYQMFEETCAEISRNGIKKIVLYNIHGGNPDFLRYFARTRLAVPRDYVLYLFEPSFDQPTQAEINKRRKSPFDSHGGEVETSQMMVITPGLVKIERANDEPGDDLQRIKTPGMFTAIQWYARFPNHYAGDAKASNPEFGRFILDYKIGKLVDAVKAVKADQTTPEILQRFYEEGEMPLGTKTTR